jgi:hypothetical protein
MLSSIKSELKQQVAEEAARDPNSSVTAADAEKVILEESKKAGAVSLQFDPNASPEEKAAQARAVCLYRSALPYTPTDILLENCRYEATAEGNGHRD